MVTRLSSMRLRPSTAPFTSGVPRSPAVCTAAIKLVASETVALSSTATPGGAVGGLVSHKARAKLSETAAAPEIHGSHGRLRARCAEAGLIVRGDLSGAIGGRAVGGRRFRSSSRRGYPGRAICRAVTGRATFRPKMWLRFLHGGPPPCRSRSLPIIGTRPIFTCSHNQAHLRRSTDNLFLPELGRREGRIVAIEA